MDHPPDSTPRGRLERFEVIEALGEGGMGKAWRARHHGTGQDVAIKAAKGSGDPRRRRSFLREVRALARMEHEGIVRILDYGEARGDHEAFGRDTLYFVMELAEGSLAEQSISRWVGLRSLLLQVLDALAHAHSHDHVHLDLKPSNILCSAGRYLVADFGITAVLGQHDDRGGISGTPAYMAPEQGLGRVRSFGPWTDLYGLGCVAWEIATGRVPFEGSNLVATVQAHVQSELPSFAPRFPVPSPFVGWLERLLAKRPDARFRSAAEAAHELAALRLDTDVDEVSASARIPSSGRRRRSPVRPPSSA